MKIISKFKDYYDYIGQTYGIDDKVVYERKDTKGTKLNDQDQKLLKFSRVGNHRFDKLVVACRVFTLCDNQLGYKLIDEVDYEKILKEEKKFYPWSMKYSKESFFFHEPKLIDLHRRNESIVFICNYNQVFTKVPKLERIQGLVSQYPAEQIWQDIYYMIANQMNKSPDLDPPVEVSNNDKIVAAGFDLKQSFRHRK